MENKIIFKEVNLVDELRKRLKEKGMFIRDFLVPLGIKRSTTIPTSIRKNNVTVPTLIKMSEIFNENLFLLYVDDYDALSAKLKEMEIKIAELERKNESLEMVNGVYKDTMALLKKRG